MKPESEQDLAEAIRSANGPLCIRGGGTRGLMVDGETLETGSLSGIRFYEPGALTMVAGTGTPLADIEAALSADGQMLAFEPYDLAGVTGADGVSTIGGVFATNTSGPRRVQVGAARDFLLGVRFVDGSGTIVKNGGRVMKNVTGYDLVKLMAGAHGTLGVMTEVSFKVLPKPETQASLVILGPRAGAAVAIMAAALGSPFDISGAFHRSRGHDGRAETYLRVEGFSGSVAYRVERLRALLEPIVAEDARRMPGSDHEIAVVDDPQGAAVPWDAVANSDQARAAPRDLWRIAVKPSDAPAIADRLPGPDGYTLDWGGGRIWTFCNAGTDLRAVLGRFDGHATLIKGAGQRRFHPEPPAIARLTAGLRAQFDPRGILNRGLMD